MEKGWVWLALLLICCSDYHKAFQFKPFASSWSSSMIRKKTDLCMKIYPDFQISTEVNKWVSANRKERPEVAVSTANSYYSVLSSLWDAILTSTRILDNEIDLMEHTAAYVYPEFDIKAIETDPSLMGRLHKASQDIIAGIDSAQSIFHANLKQHVEFMVSDIPNPTLLVLVRTVREKATGVDFDDLNTLPPLSAAEAETLPTNDLEGFPFPTVWDFISEINRPPDPHIMANLKFEYKMQDLKYDLKALARSRDVKEYIDMINCRMTRLEYWKEILQNIEEPIANPFLDMNDWSEGVKDKFRTLKMIVATDPKRAMDIAYDKKRTFIKYIEAWQDKLKRNFRWYYKRATRKVEDFNAIKMKAPWRQELMKLADITASIPFLDLKGPNITIGKVNLDEYCSDADRNIAFTTESVFDTVLFDVQKWTTKIVEVQRYAYSNAYAQYILPFDTVSQVSISKGFTAERIMRDVWEALGTWSGSTAGTSPVIVNSLLQSNKQPVRDHTEDFLDFAKQLNQFTREESMLNRVSVKELYKYWQLTNHRIVNWWTIGVDDLAVEEKFVEAYSKKNRHSKAIDTIFPINNQGYMEYSVSMKSSEKSIFMDYSKQWHSEYRDSLVKAETLIEMLPWKAKRSTGSASMLGTDPDAEVVHVTMDKTPKGKKSLMLVLPRLFRDVNSQMEMENFLTLSLFIAEQTKLFSHELKVTPLHPLMVTQKGADDLARRCPYPALLITVV